MNTLVDPRRTNDRDAPCAGRSELFTLGAEHKQVSRLVAAEISTVFTAMLLDGVSQPFALLHFELRHTDDASLEHVRNRLRRFGRT